ncbi:cyclin-like protein [Basidiobolus meristosporus CBS 931.73]|uniref:Cyclin-like protein n=1 Tax=Basidiobolus meristosporus CBS 931.73 TaxID=1314790 RepID=A0A1Y1XRF4_9FUNG|nr:cyclin-like protein [Basidiobolus meristosporus CBS 931.73]|eukprot:ORX88330.1 cyclin-like protein [Basidiobolus meristosporus CBS 931.73]
MSSRSLQWYFKKEELYKTPSSFDGISYEKEIIDRAKGCNFILNVGMTLKLPQSTLATATVYFHRFYVRHSLKEFHYYDIGATCILLAAKIEETGRKLRDIIIVCAQKAQKNDKLILEEDSKEFWRWRDTILYNEEVLLEALCFELAIEHPYRILLSLVKELQGSKKLAQTAWAFINDSLRTVLCIIYPPHIIAASALYIASKFLEESMPSLSGRSWWKLVDADFSDIEDASTQLLDQYSQLPSLCQK